MAYQSIICKWLMHKDYVLLLSAPTKNNDASIPLKPQIEVYGSQTPAIKVKSLQKTKQKPYLCKISNHLKLGFVWIDTLNIVIMGGEL